MPSLKLFGVVTYFSVIQDTYMKIFIVHSMSLNIDMNNKTHLDLFVEHSDLAEYVGESQSLSWANMPLKLSWFSTNSG